MNKNKANQYALLDSILKSYRTPQDLTENEKDVRRYVNHATSKSLGVSDEIYKALYQILYDDKFLEESDGNVKITPKGILFNENEGYKRKKRREIANFYFQIISTALLAVGTIGILILEWMKYHPEVPCK